MGQGLFHPRSWLAGLGCDLSPLDLLGANGCRIQSNRFCSGRAAQFGLEHPSWFLFANMLQMAQEKERCHWKFTTLSRFRDWDWLWPLVFLLFWALLYCLATACGRCLWRVLSHSGYPADGDCWSFLVSGSACGSAGTSPRPTYERPWPPVTATSPTGPLRPAWCRPKKRPG